MVAQLEHQFRLGRLSIQGLWFYCQVCLFSTVLFSLYNFLLESSLMVVKSMSQPMMGTMQALCIVVKKVSAHNFVGSAVLNLLQSQARITFSFLSTFALASSWYSCIIQGFNLF